MLRLVASQARLPAAHLALIGLELGWHAREAHAVHHAHAARGGHNVGIHGQDVGDGEEAHLRGSTWQWAAHQLGADASGRAGSNQIGAAASSGGA